MSEKPKRQFSFPHLDNMTARELFHLMRPRIYELEQALENIQDKCGLGIHDTYNYDPVAMLVEIDEIIDEVMHE